MFADNTYSKPFFVTYFNTSSFILPLLPMLARQAWRDPDSVRAYFSKLPLSNRIRSTYIPVSTSEEPGSNDRNKPDSPLLGARPSLPSTHSAYPSSRLTLRQTARLALEFCILWYLANYFAGACLEYTTVSSSTILTSTSSVFTLLFGSLFAVERFTPRKLLAVLASLLGVALISTVDFSSTSEDDPNRGSFPHKSRAELAIGNSMALVSAVLYGLYAVRMKARLGDESAVRVPLFFGLVGLFNVLLLWPGFLILHYTGLEPFHLPPTGRVWAIIIANASGSLIADFAWAYAVLLTSPILVTLGLSTTIPLSLVGQFLLNHQYAPPLYWLGAAVVVASFVVVNRTEEVSETHGVASVAGDDDRSATEGSIMARDG